MAKIINLLKQKVASCGSRMQKIVGLWVRAIKEPTFHQEMWGLWVTEKTISKKMGSLGDSNTENTGSLDSYHDWRHLHNGSAPCMPPFPPGAGPPGKTCNWFFVPRPPFSTTCYNILTIFNVNPNLPAPVNFVPFGTMTYSPFDINLMSITCIKFVYLYFCFLNKA